MSYYRNYRHPYHYRRYRRSFNPRNFLIIIAVLFVFWIVSSPKAFIFIFYILLAVGVYFIIKKIWRKTKTKEFQVDGGDISEINSEKHGCKCYMEGLSEGEKEVAYLLSRGLSYKDYFLFNNLILPSENNESTQIDHVVVSKFGIFVIESKDYKGWIFGDKDQASWTQSLPGGKNKFQFQNPIHQNYAHIMALKALLPFIGDNFYSIVVFSNKSEFKTAALENVVNLNGLIGYVNKYKQERLSDNDLQLAIGRLSFLCQTVDISAAEHVANLHINHK